MLPEQLEEILSRTIGQNEEVTKLAQELDLEFVEAVKHNS